MGLAFALAAGIVIGLLIGPVSAYVDIRKQERLLEEIRRENVKRQSERAA